MESVRIEPLQRPFDVTFRPPGSKSLTNRALVLAALSTGSCELQNALFADDTRVMIDGLQKLGFDIRVDDQSKSILVQGRSGEIPARSAELFCGNSGTTIRFLAALCALGSGVYQLDGVPRMRERPIGPLVTMLKNLGARVSYQERGGFAPLKIEGGFAGGLVRYGSETSSQYISAVLQIAPYARNEVFIDLIGRQTSWPYVAMTMRLMEQFDVICEVVRDEDTGEPTQIIVPPGLYSRAQYDVEPDASNASYFLGLAAIHAGAKITLAGLGRHSLQGDVGFANVLSDMGASMEVGHDYIKLEGSDRLKGIDVDLSGMPDTAQTLAVVSLFAEGPTIIRGLHTLRVKETDRLSALQRELTKLGAEVDIEGDRLTIDPPRRLQTAAIDTYDDHRMAMSFALAGSKSSGVRINDPRCVNKTYPNFFNDLEKFGVYAQ